MIIHRDIYTYFICNEIVSSGDTLGETITQYEVRSYTDTRNLAFRRAFLVTCTERMILPNPTQFTPSATSIESFDNYPALLANAITVASPNQAIEAPQLLDYWPRTLNTAVVASGSTGDSSNVTTSKQFTSGSSTAQTNSYGASLSLAGGSASGLLSYQHSGTSESPPPPPGAGPWIRVRRCQFQLDVDQGLGQLRGDRCRQYLSHLDLGGKNIPGMSFSSETSTGPTTFSFRRTFSRDFSPEAKFIPLRAVLVRH